MQKNHFRTILFVIALLSFGAVLFVYRYPYTALAPSQTTVAPTATYTIGMVGDTPFMRDVFSSTRDRITHRSGGSNVAIKFVELNTPSDTNSLTNSLNYLIEQKIDLLITGPSQYIYFHNRPLPFPVVVTLAADPVGQGLAKSENGQGNDAVFIDAGNSDTVGRRLQFFKELVPSAKKVLVLRGDPALPDELDGTYAALQKAAAKNDIQLVDQTFHSREEFNNFLLHYNFDTVDAVFRFPSMFIANNLDLFFSFIPRIQKPIIMLNKLELDRGGLLAYSADLSEVGARTADAAYDLLTKDLNVYDFPVIHVSKFYLGLNQKKARELGIPTPNSFLKKADYIITQ